MGRHLFVFNSLQTGRHPAYYSKALWFLWVGIFLFSTAFRREGTLPSIRKNSAYYGSASFCLRASSLEGLLFEGTLPPMGRHLFIFNRLQTGRNPPYDSKALCPLWVGKASCLLFEGTLPTMGRRLFIFNSIERGRHPAYYSKALCLLWVSTFLKTKQRLDRQARCIQ
jgi:hypothetical protein